MGTPVPPDGLTTDSGIMGQVLIKQGEIIAQLAVITVRLEAVPDHESRIRSLERFKWTISGMSFLGGLISGAVGYWLGHVIH